MYSLVKTLTVQLYMYLPLSMHSILCHMCWCYCMVLCSVTEGDLLDVLKMHGAQKQLRQVLNSLKKDKLIRR